MSKENGLSSSVLTASVNVKKLKHDILIGDVSFPAQLKSSIYPIIKGGMNKLNSEYMNYLMKIGILQSRPQLKLQNRLAIKTCASYSRGFKPYQ